ncbi:prolyl oligopeptidase family serine peptidase [Simiduia sp. 21SJ11W-1]|uniref:S9 family peptidase n=1 Tax=Simiduia sp. 21SJ11W-1 TaxID=2909669 RepID=UPI0020A1FA91|nr:prolyl oligopeptidase family serine peptidase [Simiduia sp. 21SJ11W-1]UTA49137.1 prolyl oligopeptidase family serine peptidase [Simiduia sp. 21SJ11W-1]
MTNKQPLPFGSWPSPIHANLLTQSAVSLAMPMLVGNTAYWLESRPEEKGRGVIVRQGIGGQPTDITPAGFNVRSKVNEYGGGDFTVSGQWVFFVNADDQQVYAQSHPLPPRQITRAPNSRFADIRHDAARNRLIAVEEIHHHKAREPEHRLVAIDLEQGTLSALASGADFYGYPALSPCGQQLAWISWQHPNMPWDENQIWLADITDGGELAGSRALLAQGCSGYQPCWSPAGELIAAHDASGWWNLYAWRNGQWAPLLPMDAEFATPQWVFGMSCYGFLDDTHLFAAYAQNGLWYCGILATDTGQWQPVDTPLTEIGNVTCANGQALMLGSNPETASALWRFDQSQWHCEKVSLENPIEPAFIAQPQTVSFPTTGNTQTHGFYYAPTHPDYTGRDGEKPPLIVLSHGGPTAATSSALNFKIQYWTSRGFAVLDVNYRGSTRYGRAYRDSLKGSWGIKDVDDVCAGAEYLVQQGLADAARLIIKGSSAGGYTVLAALTFRDVFCAGTSLYGIGDLTALAKDTHKFESRYLDSLVAPWPDGEPVYRARSPLFHIEQLTCPVAFFQGLKDKVVPPNQAEAMVHALKAKQVPTSYVTFASEGHGFREAQSIIDQLELELNFYGALFGFSVNPARADFRFE